YFSHLMGQREVYRKGPNGTRQLVTESVAMPTAFSELPTNPIEAYFMAPPPLGLWKGEVPFLERKPGEPKPAADFLPRPESDMYLLPWTKEDLERLKLPLSLLDDCKPTDDQHQSARQSPNGRRRPSGLQVVDLRGGSGQDSAQTPEK